MLFFLALILYIFSIVGFLILLVLQKSGTVILSRVLYILHACSIILLITYMVSGSYREKLPLFFPLSLLLTVCTGLLLAGHLLGRPPMRTIKMYLLLYPLTFIFFLVKPSALIHFLVNMQMNQTADKSFHVIDDLYLIKQNTITAKDTSGTPFKLVKKHGLFTQTLTRDIFFPEMTDSIHLQKKDINGSMIIIVYFINKNQIQDSSTISIAILTNN